MTEQQRKTPYLLHLDPEILKQYKQVARQEGKPTSELMRQALEKYLTTEDVDAEEPQPIELSRKEKEAIPAVVELLKRVLANG